MAVGFKLGGIVDEIGTADFLHAFFSTVSGNLEPAGWGTRFPIIMDRLYRGTLDGGVAREALGELGRIKGELAKLSPMNVIWDIDDRSRMPPWGQDISGDITDLSNYFVTSTGRDFLEVAAEVIGEMEPADRLEIVSY